MVFAQLIDKPVATVKLSKFEVISVKQFRQQLEDLEERTKNKLSTNDRRKLLDLLINEMLITQDAAMENITVTQGEISSRIALARQTGGMGLNLNRELTEQEFKQLLRQSGLTWEEYVEQLEKAILQQKYVNGASFDDLVVKYSDDKSSRYKGGDFGYLRRDDQARKQLLGKEFFETPFKLDVGQFSRVLQSNIGFHIIRVTEKIPFRLLALDNSIPPQNNSTVRDQISAQLLQQKQAEYYQQALLDLLDELKKKAEIRIFEENLSW
jgi:parvulin-like peptidyl-prolyl isomerase